MDEMIDTTTYLINFGLCALTFALTRTAIAAGSEIRVSLNRFTAVAVIVGVMTGFPLLYSLLWLFESPGQNVNVGPAERLPEKAKITIADSGIGIPPEHIQDIFGLFSQVTPALERS